MCWFRLRLYYEQKQNAIGYNANISALKQISSVSEAATIDASTDDVTYQLRQLFNASM